MSWSTSNAPKKAALTGMESHDGACYASGQRGLLIERVAEAEWDALFEDGPTGNGHAIRDVAVTDDGDRVWYCGDSGSFGYYDTAADSVEAHPGPYDLTSGFRSVAVTGPAGEERVHACDDNGKIVRVYLDGTDLSVEGVAVPGQGDAMTEVVDTGDSFHAADTAGALYYSEDGASWDREHVASTTIVALASSESGVVSVTDSGAVRRHQSLFGAGESETETLTSGVSSPEAVTAEQGNVVVVGAGGTVVVGEDDFRDASTDVDKNLLCVDLMDDGTVVAGGAEGVVLEGVPE